MTLGGADALLVINTDSAETQMPIDSIEVGAVLECDWDNRPMRVLACDEIEALYDGWLPHANAWRFTRLTGEVTYYRVSTAFLKARAVQIRMEPLTKAESAIHRPDLPLRLCRFRDLEWTKIVFPNIGVYVSAIAKSSTAVQIGVSDLVLPIPSVVLKPFGPKGGAKRSVMVNADHHSSFSALELLWKAHNIQARYSRSLEAGVGIYRSGFERGIPSYYLWGFNDKAGIITRERVT